MKDRTMCPTGQSRSESYRLLIYGNEATKIFVVRTSTGHKLPSVTVATGSRIAAEINKVTADTWGLQTYCMFTVPQPLSPNVQSRYVVLESAHSVQGPSYAGHWQDVTRLGPGDFEHADDFAAIRKSLDTLHSHSVCPIGGAFGAPGVFRKVTEWIKSQAATVGLRLTGPFRQLNGGMTFSLVRFETDGAALWFKAVGEPNLREYGITLELCTDFSDFVPQLVASQSDWNAWLTTEVDGNHPDEKSSLEVWIRVIAQMAVLQSRSFGRVLHLIDAGCHDLRVSTLMKVLDPFMDVMSVLMRTQIATSPAPLSQAELSPLRTQLRDALAILADSGIPEAISHLDLNPRNVLVSQKRCVFLDWARGAVSHPVFSLQHLLDHLKQLHTLKNSWQRELVSAYIAALGFHVGNECWLDSLEVAPLLTVFAIAVATEDWFKAACGDRQSDSARYLRGLARRMKREADTWSARRNQWSMPCQL